MKEKIKTIINKILNREDESFGEFLKKYWWIELLALGKIVIFINKEYYGYSFGILFLFSVLIVLWILYRIGLE